MKTQEKTTAGILYIVATPIGNIGDISHRALEILATVPLIACEDTRETKKLLHHYGITTSTRSYHAQSDDRVEKELLSHLESGASLALVSDRGTPGIADPGRRLISNAIAQHTSVVPIPGANAAITALQASGVNTSSFWFRGFIPHKKGRLSFLTTSITHPDTVIFYESPHRILKCLQQSMDAGIERRQIVIARELTKMHEEFLRGTTKEVFDILASRPAIKGEFVVIFDAVKNL